MRRRRRIKEGRGKEKGPKLAHTSKKGGGTLPLTFEKETPSSFFAHGAKIPLSSIKGSPNVGSILLLLRLDKLQISLFSPSYAGTEEGGGTGRRRGKG